MVEWLWMGGLLKYGKLRCFVYEGSFSPLTCKTEEIRDIRISDFRVENLTGNLLNRTTRPGRLVVTECVCVDVNFLGG